MFPNNPLFVEKLVRTKQAEIMNEIQGNSEPEFRDNLQYPLAKSEFQDMGTYWPAHRVGMVVPRISLLERRSQ